MSYHIVNIVRQLLPLSNFGHESVIDEQTCLYTADLDLPGPCTCSIPFLDYFDVCRVAKRSILLLTAYCRPARNVFEMSLPWRALRKHTRQTTKVAGLSRCLQ